MPRYEPTYPVTGVTFKLFYQHIMSVATLLQSRMTHTKLLNLSPSPYSSSWAVTRKVSLCLSGHLRQRIAAALLDAFKPRFIAFQFDIARPARQRLPQPRICLVQICHLPLVFSVVVAVYKDSLLKFIFGLKYFECILY